MRSESIPTPPSPDTPPAPYDPPQPAPQAAAWRRALRVIRYVPPKNRRMAKNTVKTAGRKA